MKTHHKKEARGVGDTADNFSEYALAQAEAMLSKLIRLVSLADYEVSQSIYGKNVNQRSHASSLAKGYLDKVKSETRSWDMVLRAKERGEDIHSVPNKTHKLDITGGEHHDFGQHIVNETKTKSEVK
jgi:hypothetical protein